MKQKMLFRPKTYNNLINANTTLKSKLILRIN